MFVGSSSQDFSSHSDDGLKPAKRLAREARNKEIKNKSEAISIPVVVVSSREQLLEALRESNPILGRSLDYRSANTLSRKILGFYDDHSGRFFCLSSVELDNEIYSRERISSSSRNNNDSALTKESAVRVFKNQNARVALSGFLLIEDSPTEASSTIKTSDLNIFFKFVVLKLHQRGVTEVSPLLANITSEIKNREVLTALKRVFSHDILDPEVVFDLASYLAPRLNKLYCQESNNKLDRKGEDKLLLLLKKIEKILDQIDDDKTALPLSTNLVQVLDSLQFSGYIETIGKELQKAEFRFLDDLSDYLSEATSFRKKNGDLLRHARIVRSRESSSGNRLEYRVPDSLFRKVTSEHFSPKDVKTLAQFYALEGRSVEQIANYFRQTLSTRDLPVSFKLYCEEVFRVLTLLSSCPDTSHQIEVNARDSDLRELSIAGNISGIGYKFKLSLKTNPPLVSLSRRKYRGEDTLEEFFSISRSGQILWTENISGTQLARVEAKHFLPSYRSGSLRTVWIDLLRRARNSKLSYFRETRLFAHEQAIKLEWPDHRSCRLKFKLKSTRNLEHELTFKDGLLQTFKESHIRNTARGNKIVTSYIDPSEGYPFFIDLIESLKATLESSNSLKTT
jgi:hypothetical protein